MPIGAQTDERGAGADGHAQVVPRHMIAPPHWIGGWCGMHLRANRRMHAVGADQQSAVRFEVEPSL